MNRIIPVAAVVGLLALACLPADAADNIYKWTDADGVIHFSSQPPASGDWHRITPQAQPANSAPGMDAIQKRSADIDSGNAKVAKAKQDALRARADDAEKCAKARERLAYLDEHPAHRLLTVGANGEESRMTDEQYAAEVTKAKDVANERCN